MLPTTYQQWNDVDIQKCITALQNRDLVAEVSESDLDPETYSETTFSAHPGGKYASSTYFRNDMDHTAPSYRPRSATSVSVETTTSPAISHNKDVISSKHYQRVMERLKALLSKHYSSPVYL